MFIHLIANIAYCLIWSLSAVIWTQRCHWRLQCIEFVLDQQTAIAVCSDGHGLIYLIWHVLAHLEIHKRVSKCKRQRHFIFETHVSVSVSLPMSSRFTPPILASCSSYSCSSLLAQVMRTISLMHCALLLSISSSPFTQFNVSINREGLRLATTESDLYWNIVPFQIYERCFWFLDNFNSFFTNVGSNVAKRIQLLWTEETDNLLKSSLMPRNHCFFNQLLYMKLLILL